MLFDSKKHACCDIRQYFIRLRGMNSVGMHQPSRNILGLEDRAISVAGEFCVHSLHTCSLCPSISEYGPNFIPDERMQRLVSRPLSLVCPSYTTTNVSSVFWSRSPGTGSSSLTSEPCLLLRFG